MRLHRRYLGQNFYLKDGKVFITANEWFQPIKEAYPEFKAEFERLGLREYASVEARNVAYATLILEWGRVVAQVRTIFERIDDATIYIPSFKDSYPTPALTISKK